VIEGGITVNDIPLQKRDALGIWDTENITISCPENAYFLIIETVVNQK